MQFIALPFHVALSSHGIDYQFDNYLQPILKSLDVNFVKKNFHRFMACQSFLPPDAHGGPAEDYSH